MDVRMSSPIDNSKYGESDERKNLNDINDNIGCCCSRDTDVSNGSNDSCEHNTDNDFLYRSTETGDEGLDNVGNNQAHERDHHTWINPVIQMRSPANQESTEASELKTTM